MGHRVQSFLRAIATAVATITLGACAIFGMADRNAAPSKLNPRFQDSASSVFPTYFAPIVGCTNSAELPIEKNMSAREELVAVILPELLGKMGAKKSPGLAPKDSQKFLCSQLFGRSLAKTTVWESSPELREFATKALEGRSESSVLLMSAVGFHRCEDVFDEVYGPDGQTVIGKIKRGRRCYEDGSIGLTLVLLTATGDLVWFSTGNTNDATYDDLLRDWPGPRGSDPVPLG